MIGIMLKHELVAVEEILGLERAWVCLAILLPSSGQIVSHTYDI